MISRFYHNHGGSVILVGGCKSDLLDTVLTEYSSYSDSFSIGAPYEVETANGPAWAVQVFFSFSDKMALQ
jgi:hypothetical protein